VIDRILNIFGVGRVSLIDDTGDMQLLQVTEGAAGKGIGDRITDKVRRVVEYGFFSVPPIDSEILVARRNGDRTLPMVIGTSHRASRPRNKQPGDAGIYNGITGAVVQMTADGLLIDCAGLPAIIRNATHVTITASEKITLDAPMVEILHDATVAGNLDVAGTITGDGVVVELGALRDAYNAHRHGGVSTGAGTTGATDHTV
jgi:phage baseplate assembly protein V